MTYIKKIKSHCVHPYFYSLFAVLFLYSRNIDQLQLSEIGIASAGILILLAVLILSADAVIKNMELTAILFLTFVFIFFSHGHILDLIWGWEIRGILVGRSLYLFIFWIMLFCSVSLCAFLWKNSLTQINKILTVFTVALLVIVSFNIGKYYLTHSFHKTQIDGIKTNQQGTAKVSATPLPDIYYIILDGYTSPKNLHTYYKFDNSDVINKLREKKFHVLENAHSNYTTSFMSLLSSLNMKYIHDDYARYDLDPGLPRQLAKTLENNAVVNFLKQKGYKFIHFSSGYCATEYNMYADWNIYCGRLSEFCRILIHTTLLRYVEARVSWGDLRHRILCQLDKIPQVQKMIDGPRFVFAHIVSPHPPYLFNAQGGPVDYKLQGIDPAGNDIWQYKGAYVEQIKFLNGRLIQMINQILTGADTPPIIIIQGDHGTASSGTGKLNTHTDTLIQERLGIFNAYYLPGDENEDVIKSLTPVNTFRFIFNKYFNAQYPLLENRYFFTSYLNRRSLDVTSNINQAAHFIQ